MFQDNAFQNNVFQTLAVIIATVLVFLSLRTTARLAPVFTTTVMSEFLGPQGLFFEFGLVVYYENGDVAYG